MKKNLMITDLKNEHIIERVRVGIRARIKNIVCMYKKHLLNVYNWVRC